MTRTQALDLMAQYANLLCEEGEQDTVLTEIDSRWPEDGGTEKAMRWLGFMQGALYVKGRFSLDDLKDHSRAGSLQ